MVALHSYLSTLFNKTLSVQPHKEDFVYCMLGWRTSSAINCFYQIRQSQKKNSLEGSLLKMTTCIQLLLFVSQDIDECQTPGVCPMGVCTNTEGSFSCMSCDLGFTVAPSGPLCEGRIQWVVRCGHKHLWSPCNHFHSHLLQHSMTYHSKNKSLHADDAWLF